jgi:hypothetical protein
MCELALSGNLQATSVNICENYKLAGIVDGVVMLWVKTRGEKSAR